ncbi:MAG: 2Fe-2S iron-sulfur cluster binding domain-containing protein [Clostridiales bacterium]|nr:2Fe-2S iron-sulfur cluster binding domain-containing protein [Clostridiales bacterium]
MKTVNVKINGVGVAVPEGSTILEAARQANITIPTLCFLKEINEIGACRICVVEVKGARSLVASCVHPVSEGMEVITNSPKVIDARKKTLQLILSDHDKKCLSCTRSGNCELQNLSYTLGIEDENYFEGESHEYEIDTSAIHMVRDNNKCILCRRCTAVCEQTQSVGVIGPNERGFNTNIGSPFGIGLGETSCISCGQCIVVCPTGALYEKDQTQEVFEALADPNKFVVVQAAPSVRVGLGEPFGLPIGTNVEGKMVAALRRLGFDKVFDTNIAADLTILEEANELIERINTGGTLPMITSCSPGWIKYCEHYFPDMIDNLSTCKSPMQMFGATTKTYYANKIGVAPEDIFVVAIMPCTAKKFEVQRDDQNAAGVPDVDVSLTVRELARMIRIADIDFNSLPDEEFDDPLGISTGAAAIFGVTGGVMEAALRTAVETLTGEELPDVEFKDVRGLEGIKEASYEVAGMTINVAVASSTSNAKELLEKVKSGEKEYHFIEVMGCPGGCVNGGGMPHVSSSIRSFENVPAKRAAALYTKDEAMTLRKSHENPAIKKLYEEFFEKPGSHKAHEILHTSYVKRRINEIV